MKKILLSIIIVILPMIIWAADINRISVGSLVLDQSSDIFMWDIGKMKEGQVLKHTFVLANDSDKLLKIKEIHTSCGCTASKIDKKNLMPGETSNIGVEFNSKGYSGEVKQFVYVSTDSSDNPLLRFIIRAVVVKS